MSQRERLNILRASLLFTFLLTIAALFHFARPVYDDGRLFQSVKWQVAVGLGALGALLELGLIPLTWTSLRTAVLGWLESLLGIFQRLKWLNFALFLAAIAGFSFLLVSQYGYHLLNIYPRLLLFWMVALGGSLFLRAGGIERSWGELLAVSILFTALGYKAAAYIPDISTYPLTLGWSETSRYYYASLYFSESLYGERFAPTVLHPSRYLLQSLPFLIPNSPLWFHRLWQVLLWLAASLGSALLLARRLSIPDRLRRWAFAAWAVLFLLIGPVYYHLLVPVILVLAFFDRRRFWRSLLAVLLASAWAGISRVNWFPVPAMLAIALYLIEEGPAGRPLWRYLLHPLAWAAGGLLVAFGAQALYAVLSGNPVEQFASSFTSDLLWYRLFPNLTYPLGILPAALLVSLPLLLLMGQSGVRWSRVHPVRWLGLAAMLLVLFAGGLVVSVKIGGGSNLHNMDAFMVLLLLVAAHFYYGRFAPDGPEGGQDARLDGRHGWSLQRLSLAAAVLIPVYFTLAGGSPVSLANHQLAREALDTIEKYALETAEQGQEVLFISERHLLTFGFIEGVPLVPEYEKVFLMEMAMSRNPEYLGQFRSDLANQRFGLIISEPLFTREKGREEVFGEENDAWVREVSKPVLCYYRPRRSLLIGVPIQILVPRDGEPNCP